MKRQYIKPASSEIRVEAAPMLTASAEISMSIYDDVVSEEDAL